MFTIDEKIILNEMVDKMITIESANLRNLKTVKFQNQNKVNKLAQKLNNLRLIKGKLASIK